MLDGMTMPAEEAPIPKAPSELAPSSVRAAKAVSGPPGPSGRTTCRHVSFSHVATRQQPPTRPFFESSVKGHVLE